MASYGNNQFSRLGRYKLSDNQKFIGGNFAPFIPAISGTGAGTTSATPGNGYTYQTFTASGTLLVSQPITADILVVGGGGAGGNAGGGGGAGGLVFVPNYNLSAGTYVISVGSGAGAASSVTGNPSYILTGAGTTFLNARGGGCGNESPISAATDGGSGGGGGQSPGGGGTATQPSYPQGIPTPSFLQYGNPGGSGSSSGGGGGGAGSAGSAYFPPVYASSGGPGGSGRQYNDFNGPLVGVPSLGPFSGYYAGGGGGLGVFNPSFGGGNGGNGGSGGGGTGAGYGPTPAVATSGGTNTGGGGGGGYPGPTSAKAGGSGIVIIRYQVSP